MQSLKTHFPEITEPTWTQLEAWSALMRDWNAKINLISRKDIDRLEEKHLAHCLVVTKVLKLMAGARVIDVGTGGGLPGLVMAICYPQAHFTLVDSVGKKIKVVEDISKQLNLENVEVRNCRAESINREFDFITGRAVKELPLFVNWVRKLSRRGKKHSLENGLLYWKGGEYAEEVDKLKIKPVHVWPIDDFLPGEEFAGKYLLHFRAQDLPQARKPPVIPIQHRIRSK
ncbi:16S rRNA (guanine(527)-N(7))-methyltransferase RsmG [Cerasicoccus arenae]|uniref:Ribosomal RNA small subunit methyltransferase G n=1 Tax=Cerasicoccus arenae TaxID=424488 RepID=A0A8J3DBG3_9BACT|nr:16S rRNA (guanine(527)-N(7))-methyltransferase RsmG [Cerasicoccus arenae]MBK1856701.1 16S rRNA (guanine(527)-N(7))-methyltransferase RsmG [Cerasicoccus arenae]GHB99007.1 ribosomal RNA small subunit methyltransferase G [Cerasicoccus arenae]